MMSDEDRRKALDDIPEGELTIEFTDGTSTAFNFKAEAERVEAEWEAFKNSPQGGMFLDGFKRGFKPVEESE